MNVWCWESPSLSSPFCLWHRHRIVRFFDRAARRHARTENLKNTGVWSQNVTSQKKKSPHHAWMSSKCFAFHSSSFFFLSLFSCTLSIVLALESGKKRLVVRVVVGNISCEWCPCLVTPEVLFNLNPSPITLLTQNTSHPLSIGVIHRCCCCLWNCFCYVYFLLLRFEIYFSWLPFTLFSHPAKKIITPAKTKLYLFLDAGVEKRQSCCQWENNCSACVSFCFVLFLLQNFPQFELWWIIPWLFCWQCNFQGSNTSL